MRYLPQRYLRWWALRGVPRWTADAPEGSRVHVTGMVRRLDELFTAPLANFPCVVAYTRFPSGNVERLQIAPFALETTTATFVVDASHVHFTLPRVPAESVERELMFLAAYSLIKSTGTFEEYAVADGQIVTVAGTVLRDGVELPRTELAFRDATATCKLVGNKHHPIVIAEPA